MSNDMTPEQIAKAEQLSQVGALLVCYYKVHFEYETSRPGSVHTCVKGFDIVTPYATLNVHGLLSWIAGYRFDGRSGPLPNTRDSIASALPHDIFYEFLREERFQLSDAGARKLRKVIDKQYRLHVYAVLMWQRSRWQRPAMWAFSRTWASMQFGILRAAGGRSASPSEKIEHMSPAR